MVIAVKFHLNNEFANDQKSKSIILSALIVYENIFYNKNNDNNNVVSIIMDR